MKLNGVLWVLLIALFALIQSCKEGPGIEPGSMQLVTIQANFETLEIQANNTGIPVDCYLKVKFSTELDTNSVNQNVQLVNSQGVPITCTYQYETDLKSVRITPQSPLEYATGYTIMISNQLKGAKGESFAGLEVHFTTEPGHFQIETITLNGKDFKNQGTLRDVDYKNLNIEIAFTEALNPDDYTIYFSLSGYTPLSVTLSQDNKQVTITNNSDLEDYVKITFNISPDLTSQSGSGFVGFSNYFFTRLDSTYKFPVITDDELLDLVQKKTFRYFYDFAEPISGMARERNNSGDVVTTGGSGFGIMTLIVAMERGFVTRQQGLDHLEKVIHFLETCDRFHGAWPHWLNGTTGKVIPFTTEDDGADLIETAFMIQGLITMRQYLDPQIQQEQGLISRINTLVDSVEWDWFTRGQNVLYWHWSPNYDWAKNLKIQGYNETLITYILAASSTTHTIGPEVYHEGYARNGAIVNGDSFYGYILPLGWDLGGPLMFTQYSYLGLDPRNLQDEYANYWQQGVNMSLINWAYCVDNPKNYVGYSEVSWGLSASDNPWGYNAQSPINDLGVITPTAAVSALPYVPEQSMNAIRHFYYILGDKLWGEYGFYDAFDVTEGWWANSYLAIDEGPIVCMIENYRTGLLWDLFMSDPEVQQGLDKLGFNY